MSNIKEILKNSSVFGSLKETEIERLETLFDRWEIFPGDILANASDTAQYFFLLNKGTLLLAMDEGKSVVLTTPGDFIGLELLSAQGIYKNCLSVLEKGSVFAVPRQDFLAVIQEDPSTASVLKASWQAYVETSVPFVKNSEDKSFSEHY